MSEKRKIQRFNLDEGRIWEAIEGLSPFKTTYTLEEVCEKLNEQQSTIQRMKHSLNTIYKAFEKHYGYDMRNAIWLIDELSYDDNEIGFDSDE